MQEFDGVFNDDPPSALTRESRTIHRLDFILTFIDQNTLETLRESGKPKPGRTRGMPVDGVSPMPTICYDGNGAPILPIHIGCNACVVDLGYIVTDRLGFHDDRYIYPAGLTIHQ
jgi:chromodomain-helicase-DNA-binding protein 7